MGRPGFIYIYPEKEMWNNPFPDVFSAKHFPMENQAFFGREFCFPFISYDTTACTAFSMHISSAKKKMNKLDLGTLTNHPMENSREPPSSSDLLDLLAHTNLKAIGFLISSYAARTPIEHCS